MRRGILKRNFEPFDWCLFFEILALLNSRPEVPVTDACVELGMPYASFLRKINRIEKIFVRQLEKYSKGKVTEGDIRNIASYIDNRRIVHKKRKDEKVRIKL